LRTRLAGLLQSRERARTLIGTRGKLIGRKLYKLATNDPRMFAKTQNGESRRVAVHLLVDLSGSMSARSQVSSTPKAGMPVVLVGGETSEFISWPGYGRSSEFLQSELALGAAQAFASAVRPLPQVNLGVTAFPGRSRKQVTVLQDHDCKPERSLRWNFITNGGTPMAEALWYAHMRMIPLTEPRKIIILLTDGAADDTDAAAAAVNAAVKSGIEVIGLALGNVPLRDVVGPENCTVVSTAEDIAPAYFRLLERLLLGREKSR
jgi:hypothetical protein